MRLRLNYNPAKIAQNHPQTQPYPPMALEAPPQPTQSTMQVSDDPEIIDLIKQIVEFELAGVIRFTHYALMVSGPNRIPHVDFFQTQAEESLQHAQRAGSILTGLGGHPSMKVTQIAETHQHDVQTILEESYAHERGAIEMYSQLVKLTSGRSVFLEEYARSMVATEEEHLMELRKMMRDLS